MLFALYVLLTCACRRSIRDKLNLSMKEKQQLQKKRAMRRKGKRFIKGSGIMSGKKR